MPGMRRGENGGEKEEKRSEKSGEKEEEGIIKWEQ